MTTYWSDGFSEESHDKEEDQVRNIALIEFLSSNRKRHLMWQ